MKFSSQAIVLCTVLVATSSSINTVNASDRKLIRNKKGRTTAKRNLIKVEAVTPTLEEIVQIDDAELVRALSGTGDGGMMLSMSMSMPSGGGNGGDSEDDNSGGGSSTGGDDGDGDSSGTDGTVAPAASPNAVPSDPTPTSMEISPTMAPASSTENPPAGIAPTTGGDGGIPASDPLESPTGGGGDPTSPSGDGSGVTPEDVSGSASRRNVNVAVAAVVTTAMIVPFLI